MRITLPHHHAKDVIKLTAYEYPEILLFFIPSQIFKIQRLHFTFLNKDLPKPCWRSQRHFLPAKPDVHSRQMAVRAK